MSNLEISVKNTKQKYREIFLTMVEQLQARVDALKPDDEDDIFAVYEKDSAGEKWQKAVLDMFENDIAKEVYRKWQEIAAYREQFSCAGCATCCRLACSEFSPEQLKQKASQGDNFATQFLSVFTPYESVGEAQKVYPEYLQLLNDTIDEDVYFYHCPKLNDCNRCSDYENRPQICRDFPDNPLSILPESCGFYQWREEVQPVALMLHATLEIANYYKEKIPNEGGK